MNGLAIHESYRADGCILIVGGSSFEYVRLLGASQLHPTDHEFILIGKVELLSIKLLIFVFDYCRFAI